jgi:hypothetical protein
VVVLDEEDAGAEVFLEDHLDEVVALLLLELGDEALGIGEFGGEVLVIASLCRKSLQRPPIRAACAWRSAGSRAWRA